MSDQAPRRTIYAPVYYRDFRCIADKCRHSCCIDWEICIDERTMEKYAPLSSIMSTVTAGEDGHCFVLTEEGRCPHLNDRGLCNIILTHGEEYLSEICKNHPRFFNDVGADRQEVGLGLVCEEACRLILESDAPFSLSPIGQVAQEKQEAQDFDAKAPRDEIIAAIQASSTDFEETVKALRASFHIPDVYTQEEWLAHFLSLEILDDAWEGRLLSAQRRGNVPFTGKHEQLEAYYKRLLIYFVYRHVSVAASRDNLRARLAFALLSVQMIKHLFETASAQTPEELRELARLYSSEIEYSEDNTADLIFEFECVC